MAGVFKVQSFILYDQYNAAGETALSQSAIADAQAYMRDHKALGYNTVTLSWGLPFDPTTGARAAKFGTDTSHEASFAELRGLAAYAKSIGLEIILKPHAQTAYATTGTNGALPENINDYSVGKFAGFSPTKFLRDWGSYLGQVSTLAQEVGAIMFDVGTENSGYDTAAFRADWQEVIRQARSNYTGKLTYDALFPIGRGFGADQVGFWDLLDVIGISAYYPLADKNDPAYADVLAGWRANHIFPGDTQPTVDVVAFLQAMSQQYGKPVQFEEFGAQSFHGVVNNPAGGGLAVKVADQLQQAWTYQSMFEAFSAANTSGWFNGYASWGQALVPGQDDPRFASYISSPSGQTNFDVRGKEAGKIMAAWNGATNYLALSDSSANGSMANDRMALYGSQGSGVASSQLKTFSPTFSFTIGGTIMNGQTPTVRISLNGVDLGSRTLENSPGTFVDPAGVRWSMPQVFSFALPEATPVSELKITLEGPISVGGPENVGTYISGATLSGLALTQFTYRPADGSAIPQTGGSSMSNGGYTLVDVNAWNSQLAARSTGAAAAPINVEGGDGVDTVYVLGKASQYILNYQSDKISLTESSGLGQNAILRHVEQLGFADGSLLNLQTHQFSTLVAGGARSAFQLSKAADGSYRLADTSAAASFTFGGADILKFSDMTVDLGMPVKTSAIAPAQLKSLVELYIAYFNRVPDAEGLAYWSGQVKQGMTIEQLNQSFYGAALQYPDLTGYSASMSNAAFVKIIYANVLGRSGAFAPPQADIDYWANSITNGQATRGSLIGTMLGAAHAYKGDAQWGWVANLLDNKIAVGETFAIGYGVTYLTAADSLSKGVAIAAAVTPTDTTAALKLIGISDAPLASFL